ncbi:hypothetical protein FB004_1111, partial [Sinorhizobium medicae]
MRAKNRAFFLIPLYGLLRIGMPAATCLISSFMCSSQESCVSKLCLYGCGRKAVGILVFKDRVLAL